MMHMAVFNQKFRIMVRIIIQAFTDLVVFLIVLYTLLLILTICSYVSTPDEKLTLGEVLFNCYTIMFGENPTYGDIKDSPPAIFLYFIATNFQVIICLNILISIVTDNYDNI